jgi:hypothetical protein
MLYLFFICFREYKHIIKVSRGKVIQVFSESIIYKPLKRNEGISKAK